MCGSFTQLVPGPDHLDRGAKVKSLGAEYHMLRRCGRVMAYTWLRPGHRGKVLGACGGDRQGSRGNKVITLTS